MEGPSLFLAAEQLQPFNKKKIVAVEGNTKIGKERLLGEKILSIFSYGKYLFFQFETFALRVHFMLFGSFEATIKGVKVTGDYPRKVRVPRLRLTLSNGTIEMYSCSIKFIEDAHAQAECDYTIDIMSSEWDSNKALKKLKLHPEEEIGDLLLDQTIFLGVGNIIKNEVLHLVKMSPKQTHIDSRTLKKLVEITRDYVFKFYEWRKKFELRKHYQVYRQHYCKTCGNKIVKEITGARQRKSHICPACQL
jgi:endonuclease-8